MPASNSSDDNLTGPDPSPGVRAFGEVEPSKAASREGLPPGYRMRADAHYIDHLESSRFPLIEWLDPALIEAPAADESRLGGLVESLRRHGMLQPLLVQRRHGRYRLIAGRKRLRAALLAGIRSVPCTLHEVDDEGARELEAAANISSAAPAEGSEPSWSPDASSDVARALDSVAFCASLLSGGPSDLSRTISIDLIRAEAWRAFCIVEASRVVRHGPSRARTLVPPRAVVSRVEQGFLADCRLRNVVMEVDNQIPDGRFVLADEGQLALGVSAATIATVALFDRATRSVLRLGASVASTGQASFAVSQNAAAAPDAWVSRAFDPGWAERPGGAPAATLMLALKRIADASAGVVTAQSTRRGTSITLTLPAS